MEPAEAVLRFLAGVGPGSEAEFYLRLFRSRARESFAAIVFDPETWRENADGVTLDLRLLATLSLTPVVVLGFYQPERADENARILAAKLASLGVATCRVHSSDGRDACAQAARRGEIPLLTLQAADVEEREHEFARVLASLETHKLIFLRNEGGLTLNGRRVSVVNLSDEFDELIARPALSPDQKRLLSASRNLVLALRPHELLITITSPLSILHELFTVKGAGTLLRCGASILRLEGLGEGGEGGEVGEVDLARLSSLLEDSFGKPLSEQALQRPFTHLYLEASYRGAALVAATPLGSYLSKFAVTRQAQGEGLGRDLWQAMLGDHKRLFWRARNDNPIRSWYEKQCDGRVRAGEWVVYSIGIEPEHFPAVVAHALSQPRDF